MISKYKHFSVAFKQDEYECADNFFNKFGGFSKFVKIEMKKKGYRNLHDLLRAAHKIKNSALKEYNEMENTLSDGL